MVYEVTKPSSQRTNKITTMVQSIFAPPPVASCDDPTHFVRKDPLRANASAEGLSHGLIFRAHADLAPLRAVC